MTVVLGLTGSIGMGKSTTAQMFRDLGHAVYDADAEVHALYSAEAVEPVEALFPDAVVDGVIDRQRLARAVTGHPDRLKALERIVHPLVRDRERRFVEAARARGDALVVLDIPLLFETGGEQRCDLVLVVTAPEAVQRARVLARPGMTAKKLDALLARQTPDAVKRQQADFIVDTSLGLAVTQDTIKAIVARLLTSGHPATGETT